MNAEIQAALDPAAIAREPTQARARQRFEAVLAEAELMLAESGLTQFSIPELAGRLDMTRGSIYAYFPTHYAILNELSSRYLGELEALFLNRSEEFLRLPWRDSVRAVVDQAVSFHNDKPVARLLILGGAVTDNSYRAQEALMERLGQLGRSVWERRTRGGKLLPQTPDVFTVSVDIAVACYRRSFFEWGKITDAYRDTAVLAMQQFLAVYLED